MGLFRNLTLPASATLTLNLIIIGNLRQSSEVVGKCREVRVIWIKISRIWSRKSRQTCAELLTLSSCWEVSALQRYGLAANKLRILTASIIFVRNELTANLVSCFIVRLQGAASRWRKAVPQGDNSTDVPSLYLINKLSFSYKMNKSREFASRNVFKTAAIFILPKQIKAWLLIEWRHVRKYALRKRRCRYSFRRGFDRRFNDINTTNFGTKIRPPELALYCCLISWRSHVVGLW